MTRNSADSSALHNALTRLAELVRGSSSRANTVQQSVAVGTPVTRRPPHRSLRAALPHKAPTSGTNAQSLFGIRMKSSHGWESIGSQSVHALSGNSVTLAPSPQRPEPKTTHLIPESSEFPLVTRHSVVLEVSLHNAA